MLNGGWAYPSAIKALLLKSLGRDIPANADAADTPLGITSIRAIKSNEYLINFKKIKENFFRNKHIVGKVKVNLSHIYKINFKSKII